MEIIVDWRYKLLRGIEDAGLLRRPRHTQLLSGRRGIEGVIDVDGHAVTVEIDVEPLNQYKLPIIRLLPWDALGFIPHVDPRGYICYLEQEGIVLDQQRPVDIVRDCLDEVRRTLHEGMTGKNRGDFVDEFEVYWARLEGCVGALSGLDLSDLVGEVVVAYSRNARSQLRIAQDIDAIRYIAGDAGDHGPWWTAKAVYLPLERNSMVVPPRSDQSFWTVDEVRGLLTYCSEANRARLSQILTRAVSPIEYIIVRLQRPSGGASLFGIRFEGVSEQHPLVEGGHAAKLVPIAIFRRDKAYLVQRGGGAMEWNNKRVLLVGCGAVGGHIAWELARAGVGQLGLVDPDTLGPQNTYRHVLGKRYWGRNKAGALKQEIIAHLPFANIAVVPDAIARALNSQRIKLEDYHLVVCAIGDPTVELALNERVRQSADGPPIVFTWLEPLGIGGHAVLTGNGGAGCFECLYTRPNNDDGRLVNRASFAATDQKFTRALAGCDTLHTPYGSMDASQTALLAVRLALDTLTGKVQGNHLRSWKGDATAFLAAPFKLARRYDNDSEELARQATLFASRSCRICGEPEHTQLS